jgi:hypothetical protein
MQDLEKLQLRWQFRLSNQEDCTKAIDCSQTNSRAPLTHNPSLTGYGYWQGRIGNFGLSNLIGKATNLVSLPLPVLSFVALPLFGGSSTRMSLVAVYLTWTALLFRLATSTGSEYLSIS